MLATLKIEVPPGTECIDVFVRFISGVAAANIIHVQRRNPGDGAASGQPPKGPRGDQLWLPYEGWECDAGGWRRLEP